MAVTDQGNAGNLAGRMRERVTVQRPASPQAPDTYGDPADTFTDLATVWAEVLPVGSRRETVAEQLTLVNDFKVTIRYRADVNGTMRLSWRGRTLNIEAVQNPDGRKVALELTCSEWSRP